MAPIPYPRGFRRPHRRQDGLEFLTQFYAQPSQPSEAKDVGEALFVSMYGNRFCNMHLNMLARNPPLPT